MYFFIIVIVTHSNQNFAFAHQGDFKCKFSVSKDVASLAIASPSLDLCKKAHEMDKEEPYTLYLSLADVE